MSLELTINTFCSHNSKLREQSENVVSHSVNSGSRNSLCSRHNLQCAGEILLKKVNDCCKDIDVDPLEIINRLLSKDDEQDIIYDIIIADEWRWVVLLWIKAGKPYRSSKASDI